MLINRMESCCLMSRSLLFNFEFGKLSLPLNVLLGWCQYLQTRYNYTVFARWRCFNPIVILLSTSGLILCNTACLLQSLPVPSSGRVNGSWEGLSLHKLCPDYLGKHNYECWACFLQRRLQTRSSSLCIYESLLFSNGLLAGRFQGEPAPLVKWMCLNVLHF